MQAAIGARAARPARGVRRGAAPEPRVPARGAGATTPTTCCSPRRRPAPRASWFGFAITVRPEAPYSRARPRHLPRGARHRHPPAVRRQPAAPARLPGRPRTASSATSPSPTSWPSGSFWIGCYPGLDGPRSTTSSRRSPRSARAGRWRGQRDRAPPRVRSGGGRRRHPRPGRRARAARPPPRDARPVLEREHARSARTRPATTPA